MLDSCLGTCVIITTASLHYYSSACFTFLLMVKVCYREARWIKIDYTYIDLD